MASYHGALGTWVLLCGAALLRTHALELQTMGTIVVESKADADEEFGGWCRDDVRNAIQKLSDKIGFTHGHRTAHHSVPRNYIDKVVDAYWRAPTHDVSKFKTVYNEICAHYGFQPGTGKKKFKTNVESIPFNIIVGPASARRVNDPGPGYDARLAFPNLELALRDFYLTGGAMLDGTSQRTTGGWVREPLHWTAADWIWAADRLKDALNAAKFIESSPRPSVKMEQVNPSAPGYLFVDVGIWYQAPGPNGARSDDISKAWWQKTNPDTSNTDNQFTGPSKSGRQGLYTPFGGSSPHADSVASGKVGTPFDERTVVDQVKHSHA